MNDPIQKPKSLIRELIALGLVPNLGAYRIGLLMKVVDHPRDIFRLSEKQLTRIEGVGQAVATSIRSFNDWGEVDRLLEETERSGSQIVTIRDEAYPLLLKEIYDPPALFWIKGDPEVLSTDGIAVIGTRSATDYGRDKAEAFSRELVRKGLTVVSGLAYGIDAEAHKATLNAGGKTVAVLGSGIDKIYPGTHRGLAARIIENGGAVITEFPPGTKPDAGNFPMRNRVVSGLTLGTLVIESGIRGGSMITARSALDQNREVFAIPHSIDNRNGEGCNALIKRGWGKLVQDIDDIIVEIPVTQAYGSDKGNVSPPPSRWKNLELDELAASICQWLEQGSLHIDDLSGHLEMTPQKLLPKLLELEMLECVRQTAGRNFELR